MVKADIKRNYYADLELPNVRLLRQLESMHPQLTSRTGCLRRGYQEGIPQAR
jgi:hypothetical protein